jgi:hypothetical protein
MFHFIFLWFLIIVPSATLMCFLIYNLYLVSKILKIYMAKNSDI